MGNEFTKHLGINTKEWQKTEKEVNLELERQRQHYRPENIEEMASKTGFSKREIQLLYRSFKENSPNGYVTQQQFLEIYSDFFRFGDATEYAHLVFNTFDEDGNGEISFQEFVQGLSNLWRGTLEMKLCWIFDLYDFDRKGYITEKNMLRILQSIYSMMGQLSTEESQHIVEHARDVFKKMDANSDGQITLREFVDCCRRDVTICESLALFQSLLETLHTDQPERKTMLLTKRRSFC